MNDPERERDEVIAGCEAAHERLLDTIGSIDDTVARSPSTLPGWTIGHLVTHLARNADSIVLLLEGAARGEICDQYPGGLDQRAADIELGAPRPADELVEDSRSSIERLEACWHTLPDAAWAGTARSALGDLVAVRDLPFRRWREVEIHHADAGLPSFRPADWSPGYVRRELALQLVLWRSRQPMGINGDLPLTARRLPEHERLMWLLGRSVPEGLEPVSGWR